MNEKQENHKKLKIFGIPYLFRFMKPHKQLIIMVIVFMGAGSLMESAFPLFQNYAINHYIAGGTLDTVPAFIALYIAMLLIQALINGIGMFAAAKAEVLVGRDIKQACFDHVQTLSMSYFHENSVGYIHSRMIADPDRIGVLVSWSLMDIVIDVFYLIGIGFVMSRLNMRLSLLLMCVVPVEIGVTWFFHRFIVTSGRAEREQNGIITGRFNEGITGVRTIRSMVIEPQVTAEFEHETLKMSKAAIRAGHFRSLYNGSIVFCAGAALAAVLWRGGVIHEQGLLLIGTLTVFMNYALSISAYVQALVSTVSNMISTQVNIERVAALLAAESDVKDSPEVIEKYGDSFHPKKENWETVVGDYRFEDVTFRYPGTETNILEHFDLTIPHGKLTAIVGETGAGKSTIVNLLCRFYEPTEGRILLDEKDIRERSQLWLHSHIGYVLQDPYLFDDTIRENLRYAKTDATDAEMIAALEKIGADKSFKKFEKGLDQRVGEGGSLLSAGEKQLISFARALIADPDILILDEATSSVDTLTEQTIKQAMQELTKSRTSIVIAHRLSTIRNADCILVMEQGKVVESGTHDELMAKKGKYYTLAAKVKAEAEEAAFEGNA